MTEIFTDINDNIKSMSDTIWKIAIAQPTPKEAAKFLNNAIAYYNTQWKEEEIEFLQFYLQMQMEMINK